MKKNTLLSALNIHLYSAIHIEQEHTSKKNMKIRQKDEE